MEIFTLSDIFLNEYYVHQTCKNIMPYKKTGFFDDRILNKTIGDLKSNLKKKEGLIYKYNPSEILKKKTYNQDANLSIKDNNYENFISKEERIINFIRSKSNTKEKLHKTKKYVFNNKNNQNKELQAISIKKIILNSNRKTDKDGTPNSDDSKNNKINSDLIDNKYHKLIKSKNKSIIKLELKSGNSENEIKNQNKPSILKNKLILGRLIKNKRQESIVPDFFNVKKTLYSKLLSPKIEEPDKYSIDEMNIYNRNSSVEFDHESITLNDKEGNDFDKFNSSKRKEVIHSKIDFIYKKIFDKRSPCLFEKSDLNENSSLAKKKLKNELEQENEYLKTLGNIKKKQYIEDKIQDIKRKIFFIKGVYDFSYPQIIVKKIKKSQDLYNLSHMDQKTKLREPLNYTSKKVYKNKKDDLILMNDEFGKSMQIEKLNNLTEINTYQTLNQENSTSNMEQKMLKSSSSFDLNFLKNSRLKLTNKFIHPEEINNFRIITPIGIHTIRPDLGPPSKLKVIHKSKIL